MNVSDSLLASGQLFDVVSIHGFERGNGVYLSIADSERCTERVLERWRFAETRRALSRVRATSLAEERRKLIFDYDTMVKRIAELSERSHREGLLGEILAELAIPDCSPKSALIFVNYHLTGTPTRPGIDLAGFANLSDQLWVLLVESKFTEQGTPHVIHLKDEALVSLSDRCESELRFAQVIFQVVYHSVNREKTEDLVERMKQAFGDERILAFAFLASDDASVDWRQIICSPPFTLFTLSNFRSSFLKIESSSEIVRLLD